MNPVSSLQFMLNELRRVNPNLPELVLSGIFDELTLEAVMVFQRDMGLPVTGIVDQAVWDAITAAFYQMQMDVGTPPPLHAFPNGFHTFCVGHGNPEVVVAQSLFNALSALVTNFEATDMDSINSGPTLNNIRALQRLSSLADSGELNRATWAFLTYLYRAYITRRPLESRYAGLI